MSSHLRLLCVISVVLSLAGCDKPSSPAAAASSTEETENQLADARDALQRQALEIETKTALMDLQFAEMEQTLKDHQSAELQDSLDALKRQNDELRVQADAARQQSNKLTQRIAVTPTPNVTAQPMVLPDYSLFYERLAPYGRWLDVNGYGYCWLPTITVMGWRPYVDGCWVWSSLGWAWQSNEPFGWATYHYGRWVNLVSYGWVWVPGSEWAPAWVAWRQSLDCVGWAPLPPEPGVCSGVYRDCDSRYGLGPTSYTFITTNQFVSTSYINVYAPLTRQTTIFQHSVNVTQIVPRHGRGHSFVNQGGPPLAQMEQACGRPVPQRQVQTMHADQVPVLHHQPGGHREAAAPVAVVELPAVKPGAHVVHPDVREQIQHPARVNGFQGVPQHVASEIRENISREREAATVQQQPAHGRMPPEHARHPVEPPAVVRVPPVLNPPPQEIVRPAMTEVPSSGRSVESPPRQHRPTENRGMQHHTPAEAQAAPPAAMPSPSADSGISQQAATVRATEEEAANAAAEKARVHAAEQARGATMQHRQRQEFQDRAMAGKRAAEQASAMEAERTRRQEATAAQQRMATEQATAESEKARRHVEVDAMRQRQKQELQARAQAEKLAAEQQAAAAVEAEKTRMQAVAAQQQAAAETEKARQQAEATAHQQRMAAEQAAAEAENTRRQTEAAAMQRQQDEAARRVVEEQQMRAQQEAAQRAAQEMAQRQAEEQARRHQEAEMQRAQEQARQEQMRAQQEAAQRAAQEMAQRQAEEQARRHQEAEMQRAQEQARQEHMRAQQEAAQRAAQEMAQRQAEEQARRHQEAEMQRAQEQARQEQMRAQQEAAQRTAQEMAQRQAEEAARRAQEEAQRAAAEAARNQPQPAPGS